MIVFQPLYCNVSLAFPAVFVGRVRMLDNNDKVL